MMYPEPTPEQCTERASVARADLTAHAFAAWHPQWGGYVGACVVEFESNSTVRDFPPCFTVMNWHDGQFPTRDRDPATVLHYCDARQLVDFGVLILERQADACQAGLDDEWCDSMIERVEALRAAQSKAQPGETAVPDRG